MRCASVLHLASSSSFGQICGCYLCAIQPLSGLICAEGNLTYCLTRGGNQVSTCLHPFRPATRAETLDRTPDTSGPSLTALAIPPKPQLCARTKTRNIQPNCCKVRGETLVTLVREPGVSEFLKIPRYPKYINGQKKTYHISYTLSHHMYYSWNSELRTQTVT